MKIKRQFYSQKAMSEIRREEAIWNSRMKREKEHLPSNHFSKCSCGQGEWCGMFLEKK